MTKPSEKDLEKAIAILASVAQKTSSIFGGFTASQEYLHYLSIEVSKALAAERAAGFEAGLRARMPELVETKLDEIHTRVCDLASGRVRWRMSIPANPDDSDVYICDRIVEIQKLLAANMRKGDE